MKLVWDQYSTFNKKMFTQEYEAFFHYELK